MSLKNTYKICYKLPEVCNLLTEELPYRYRSGTLTIDLEKLYSETVFSRIYVFLVHIYMNACQQRQWWIQDLVNYKSVWLKEVFLRSSDIFRIYEYKNSWKTHVKKIIYQQSSTLQSCHPATSLQMFPIKCFSRTPTLRLVKLHDGTAYSRT